MKRRELIDYLLENHMQEREELEKMDMSDLMELYDEVATPDGTYPNNDAYDGSHDYD